MLLSTNKTYIVATLLSLSLFSAHTAWGKAGFTAAQACDAYTSIHKLTNPDAAKLDKGKSYPILKGNRPQNPQWYLLRLESANPPERWVKVECGKMAILTGASNSPAGEACQITNHSDSYVFAVSWQPAFCESKPDKTECKINDPNVYQASHFTLHGLWPNKRSCGTNYGYCGEVKTKPADFCDYPPVGLSPEIHDKLAEVMPSVGSKSCLERHEWHKHGTCQNSTPDQYYAQATSLVHQFNDSGIAKFISDNIGKDVSMQEFRTAIDADLGAGASKRAKIGCDKKGLLVDIYINLPAVIKPDASLKDLIAQAPEATADNSCKDSFHVDRIGQ